LEQTLFRFRRIAAAAVGLAAINVGLLVFLDSYDLRLGPIHLAAHGLFKPLLYLNGAVMLYLCLQEPVVTVPKRWSPSPIWIALCSAGIYVPSFWLNASVDSTNDWVHLADISQINSIADLADLFAWRQPDGFYRPLTFVSLCLDRVLFGSHLWAYHFQNVALHAANAVLVARLGKKLGIDEASSRWAGLLFGVAALHYEPVIWPGARFDLLACLFVLLAISAAAEDPLPVAKITAYFVAGVLSKESAYCFPLLLAALIWLKRPSKWAPALTAVGTASLALLAIRWMIFGGLGGYPVEAGSPHFALGFTSFTSLFTRALPVPLFSMNTESLALLAKTAILLYTAWASWTAISSTARTNRPAWIWIAAALISALPALNLVNWIGPDARNVRYLYLPSIWMAYLVATTRAKPVLFSLLAAANALATIVNIRTFRWYGTSIGP
jgi:hypothetical protein